MSPVACAFSISHGRIDLVTGSQHYQKNLVPTFCEEGSPSAVFRQREARAYTGRELTLQLSDNEMDTWKMRRQSNLWWWVKSLMSLECPVRRDIGQDRQ